MQTWEDWRQSDVFHLLYDWLLVLLQERLLTQGTHASSISTAWQQMLWVAALTLLLLSTSAIKLLWAGLQRLFASGDLTNRFYVMSMRGMLQSLHMPCARSPPMCPLTTGRKELEVWVEAV